MRREGRQRHKGQLAAVAASAGCRHARRHSAAVLSRCIALSLPILCSIDFQLAQDPNSSNLGTTVWDASIVLAKYIEKARPMFNSLERLRHCGFKAA